MNFQLPVLKLKLKEFPVITIADSFQKGLFESHSHNHSFQLFCSPISQREILPSYGVPNEFPFRHSGTFDK